MKYVGADCGLIAGTETCGNNPSNTSFHATYPFKNATFGVSGNLQNPAALNYAVAKDGVSLETDLQKFALNIYNKVRTEYVQIGPIKMRITQIIGWQHNCHCLPS